MKKLLFLSIIGLHIGLQAIYTIRPGYNLKATIELFDAIREKDTAKAEKSIKNGADVKAKNIDQVTPLHWAAKHNNQEAIKLFIEHGADVKAKNGEQNTPLHIAAKHNNQEAIKLFIEHGADVKAKNWEQNTPLHIAAMNHNQEAIKLLHDRGADVNAKDFTGWTPLHWAVRNENPEAIKLLIERGGAEILVVKNCTMLDQVIAKINEDRQKFARRLLPDILGQDMKDMILDFYGLFLPSATEIANDPAKKRMADAIQQEVRNNIVKKREIVKKAAKAKKS